MADQLELPPVVITALKIIARNSCERSTEGPGSCWTNPSRKKHAKFTAEKWCDACIALDAINKATT